MATFKRGVTDITFGRLEEIAKSLNVQTTDIINLPESFHIGSITNSQAQVG
jgi:DNA-binding Xre family transcriptional regulator